MTGPADCTREHEVFYGQVQAVPEPASLILVGSSLLGVRLLRRRNVSERTWRRR